MAERLRLGVVGAGAVTQVGHLPALKRIKEIEVVGICDNDVAKARTLADRFGIPDAYDDIEELVEYDALDALLICTPSHLHESHIQAALSSGLHVFVERPLALTAVGAQKLVKSAQRHERVMMVGANHRYRPDVQQIRSFVQHGELGDLESIRAWWFLARAGRVPLGWRQKRELAGGGAMLDLGLGLLDLSLWLTGFLDARRGGVGGVSRARQREERGTVRHGDDCARGRCRHSPRCVLALRGSGRAVRACGARLPRFRGDRSAGDLEGVSRRTAGRRSDGGAFPRDTICPWPPRAQWAHFVAAVRGESPAPGLQEQVTVLQVMEAIYKSAETGKDVAL